jgi:hypothetical protein
LEEIVLDRCGSCPSLEGLYLQTGKTFASPAINCEGGWCGSVEISTWQTSPHLSCVDACLRAINVPYVCDSGITHVDSLLSLPSPVEYFDNGETRVLNVMIQNASAIGGPLDKQNPERTGGFAPGSLLSLIQETGSSLPPQLGALRPAIQTINSLILSRQFDCIDRTSEAVRHIMIPCYAPDPTAYTADPPRLLADGFSTGWRYHSRGYIDPHIAVPSMFDYPEESHSDSIPHDDT